MMCNGTALKLGDQPFVIPDGLQPCQPTSDQQSWMISVLSCRSLGGFVIVSIAQPSSAAPDVTFDVRDEPHEDVLEHVEHAFGGMLDQSSVVYGIHGATEGFRTDRDTWVRIEWRPRWWINGAVWIGLEAASAIRGVRKPAWFQSTTWTDKARDVVWRADEVELITSPSVRAAGGLVVALTLPDSWWAGLKESLTALGKHKTERVGMSQAHLSKRIGQVFDGVDTRVDEWATAHTDLHWSNVTTDGHLLDWEDWGAAPRGHDAAVLWQSSLPNSALAAQVQREFTADLQTRSGKLTQLLQCANAIRIAAKRGNTTALSESAKAAAEVLLAELRS